MHCRKIDNSSYCKLRILFFAFLFVLLFGSSVAAREITLTWDPNNEPDLNHYVVYWGNTPGDYFDNSGDIGLVNEYSAVIPDDGNTYFFAVTAVNDSGFESDYSNEVDTGAASVHIISVTDNWNLISIPSGQESILIEEILDPIMDDIISIWAYSNGAWHVYDPQNPDFSDLIEIEPGKGLWVNMREDAELIISGISPVDEIELAEGWNLVGSGLTASQDMTDTISSILEDVESVWAYQDGQWKVYDPIYPGFSDLMTMEPGKGYWIKTYRQCLWN